jgi:hypothetical protein
MDTESRTIVCSTHGDAHPTYLCEHLVANPVQRWHCGYPSQENPWPDAWCPVCDMEYLKEGEWNENNEGNLKIKLACHHCYESFRSQSAGALEGEELARWSAFATRCHDEFLARQEALEAEFSLDDQEGWSWDQEKGELTFSSDGIPAVIAKVDFIGSFSSQSDTWLWSWANFHLPENARRRMEEVRGFGEEERFPRLTVPKWAARELDGWVMSAIAVHVLEARGVYCNPGGNVTGFFLIWDLRRPARAVQELGRFRRRLRNSR